MPVSSGFSRLRRPEPRIVFFSGGTALGPLAHVLARFTRRAVHVVTPFDSGGSSGELRRAFRMPAVGDLRARLISLTDPRLPRSRELKTALEHRLTTADQAEARAELENLITGNHPLLEALTSFQLRTVQRRLRDFLIAADALPGRTVDLRGACVGNLILAGYGTRRPDRAAASLARLLRARGRVFLAADVDAQLCVRLADGRVIAGQHRFTGKNEPPISSPIEDIWLCATPDNLTPIRPSIPEHLYRRISRADLICYPMGSFYSSLLAGLLPQGVGAAVAEAACPKVFIPNLTPDPELLGHTIQLQVERLLHVLERDAPSPSARGSLPLPYLSAVLADPDATRYPGGLPEDRLAARGIRVLRTRLVTPESAPLPDPELLCAALLQLCA